jgi:hypothetical protein
VLHNLCYFLQVLADLDCGGDPTYQKLQQSGKAVTSPPSLKLSLEELESTRAALDGPLYSTHAKDVPRLLLMRLNEFVLHRSGSGYVSYNVRTPAGRIQTVCAVCPCCVL